jgi:hypothetical protein
MVDRVEACERWWRQTNNPLYVWEAIALSRDALAPIPDWCLPYIKGVAVNITDLSWAASRGEVAADRACGKVAEKLGLVRPRSKNAFARILDDKDVAKAALDSERGHQRHGAIEALREQRSIDEDRAARLLNRGKRLLGSHPK